MKKPGLIEREWEAFRGELLHEDAPANIVDVTRAAFYYGAMAAAQVLGGFLTVGLDGIQSEVEELSKEHCRKYCNHDHGHTH